MRTKDLCPILESIQLLCSGLHTIQLRPTLFQVSTLTMQTVRLMHPELQTRSFKTKLMQMLEAVRLERHFTKDETVFTFRLPHMGGILKVSKLRSMVSKDQLADNE